MAQGRSHPPEIPDVLAEPITFLCQRTRLGGVAQHRGHLTEKAKAMRGESSIPKRLRTHQRFPDERRSFLHLSLSTENHPDMPKAPSFAPCVAKRAAEPQAFLEMVPCFGVIPLEIRQHAKRGQRKQECFASASTVQEGQTFVDHDLCLLILTGSQAEPSLPCVEVPTYHPLLFCLLCLLPFSL